MKNHINIRCMKNSLLNSSIINFNSDVLVIIRISANYVNKKLLTKINISNAKLSKQISKNVFYDTK